MEEVVLFRAHQVRRVAVMEIGDLGVNPDRNLMQNAKLFIALGYFVAK